MLFGNSVCSCQEFKHLPTLKYKTKTQLNSRSIKDNDYSNNKFATKTLSSFVGKFSIQVNAESPFKYFRNTKPIKPLTNIQQQMSDNSWVVDVGAPWATFQPKLEKSKKPTPKKVFIFSQKNVFLIFWEMEFLKPKQQKSS